MSSLYWGKGVGVGNGDEKAEDEVSQDLNCNYMYISFTKFSILVSN